MKFSTHSDYAGKENFFVVTIKDTEFEMQDSKILRAFQELVLRYLAKMIAAYWFKRNKELLNEITEKSKEIIAERVAQDILNRMGIALKDYQ